MLRMIFKRLPERSEQSLTCSRQEKNKKTYLAAMDMFHEMTVHKRGHVEFIYAALAEMESYGVHKDIEAYRKVLGVFPVGQMVATNVWQVRGYELASEIANSGARFKHGQ